MRFCKHILSLIIVFFSYILFQICPTIADIIVAIVYFGTAFNGWFAFIVFVTMLLYVGKICLCCYLVLIH